jgi:hypothetical protein
MTDAPETIRASLTAVRDGWYELVNVKTGQREFKMTEYTRTDISQARYNKLERQAVNLTEAQMQWEARIAELEAALECVLHYVNTSGEAAQKAANEIQDTPAIDAVVFARAALKAKP